MTRLTAQEIEEIRKRAEKATDSPWRIEKSGYVCNAGFWTEDTLIMPDISSDVYEEADAEFIVNAREDIPKLLAEVARLQSQVDRMVSSAYEYLDTSTHTYMVAEELEREDA